MKQKKLFGSLIILALIAIILLGYSPTSAAPSAQSASPTRTATITPTNTPVPPTATSTSTKTAVPPTATSTVTPTATLPTSTATKTATATVKPTATVTPTAGVSVTATVTKTATITSAAAMTKTATTTPTKTATATPTKPKALAARVSATNPVSLTTMFVVQNISSTTASVVPTFYDTSGNTFNSTTTIACENSTFSLSSLPAYYSCIIDQRVAGGGLDGATLPWNGSVVLSSNTQLATVVNEFAGNASTLGPSFRADSYNGVSSSQADTTALLPQVVKNITDTGQQKTYNSIIAIQNAGDVTATATMTFTNIYTGTLVNSVHSGIVISPSTSVYINMQNEVPQWSQFFGPVRISADQKIAAVVNQNADGSLMVYRGFASADGDTSIVVTQAVTNIYDSGQQLNYGSAVEGMTVNGSSTTVTAEFSNLLGGSKVCTLSTNAPTFRIDMRPIYWPANCTPPVASDGRFFGTIKFTAGTPIVAISNVNSDYNSSRGVRTQTARLFPVTATDGSMTAFAPFLAYNYYDTGTNVNWSTALEAKFLVGTGTATITYYDMDSSSTWTDTYTAGSNQIFRWDQRYNSALYGKRVSAVISAPHPFVFTVNTQGDSSALGDAYTLYMSR